MEEIKNYLSYQIEHLEKWDKNKTLSEFGKGKIDAFKDVMSQLTLTDVVKSLPSEDLKFIYSLLPEWTKEAPSGLNPTLYGTLTQEGDQKVIDRLNEILK